MASGMYTNFKENCLTQAIALDFDTALIEARLVNTGTDYTYSAAHVYADEVTEYLSTTDQPLSNKTMTGGTFDNTQTVTFSSVAIDGAKTADAVVIFHDTTTETTSPLICYLEFVASVTPNGGDIIVDWNGSGLFSL